jgi:hypothetical protein
MKFTRTKQITWNGLKELPSEINVLSSHPEMAEFELLSVIATLHGVTAFDMLVGAGEGTEKDRDINQVMEAFQHYISPKMPLANYSQKDKRIINKI